MTDLLSRIDAGVLNAMVPPATGPRALRRKMIIDAFGGQLQTVLPHYEIDTPLRIAHFLAQCAHESDGFQTTEEYASGAAYETRTDLGNTAAVDGDGPRFKGRGLIQLTGRANYERFTEWMRALSNCPDFNTQPELLCNFPWAAWSAVMYWTTHKLNVLADRDDLVGITLAVNGGRNGLSSRSNYLSRAKTAIAMLTADQLSGAQHFAVLRRGMAGVLVEALQRKLAAAGFYHLTIDGFFGAGTEQAVRQLQAAHKLTIDGIAGAGTYGVFNAVPIPQPA